MAAVTGSNDVERGVTRARWLERGLVLCGAVASGGILGGGFAAFASSSPSHSQDTEILNFALAFEELQAELYRRVAAGITLSGDWPEFVQVVGAHEQAHVQFLRTTLGVAANPAPRMSWTRPPADAAEFQRTAVALEDLGVALYNGQATNLTPSALAAAAEIVSVEARHAAWARDLAGQIPAPVASDVPVDANQAQAGLMELGVRVG
jgi:hypothetical protein